MRNRYFIVGASFKDLIRRAREYWTASPPPGFETLRADVDEPLQVSDGTFAWAATVYAVLPDQTVVKLLELNAQEANGICRVRTRCLEPRVEGWHQGMVDWLAPGGDSGAVHPLPDLPSSGDLPELSPPPSHRAAITSPVPQEMKAAKAQPPKPPRTSRTSEKPKKDSKPRGRQPGTKNKPRDERDRCCEEYLRLGDRIKLRDFCKARDTKESTFCYWLRNYKKRNPDWRKIFSNS